jgi:RNA polymerase sigma factor (sigma-70 family)
MSLDRTGRTDLMDRAASGDDAAFGQLALDVQDDLYRFALAHGLKGADAAEVTQETFLRAYRARDAWRKGSDVSGWLYGIAMNVVREFHRRNRRRGTEGLELDELAATDCDRPGRIGQSSPDVPEEVDAAMSKQVLAEALDLLPPRQHEAVVCRFLMGMSLQETADVMGCAEGTIKAAVFAALENLRKILKTSNGARR